MTGSEQREAARQFIYCFFHVHLFPLLIFYFNKYCYNL